MMLAPRVQMSVFTHHGLDDAIIRAPPDAVNCTGVFIRSNDLRRELIQYPFIC